MTIHEALAIVRPEPLDPRAAWPADFTLEESVAISTALMDTLDRLRPQLDKGPRGVGERYFWTHSALCKVRGF